MPPIERPVRTDNPAEAEEKPIPLLELVRLQRERADRILSLPLAERSAMIDGGNGDGD